MNRIKTSLSICFCVLALCLELQAQKLKSSNYTGSTDTLYAVQFFASRYANRSFPDVSSLGNLIREKIPWKKVYRYKIGFFQTHSEAKTTLNRVIQLGYEDAFLNYIMTDLAVNQELARAVVASSVKDKITRVDSPVIENIEAIPEQVQIDLILQDSAVNLLSIPAPDTSTVKDSEVEVPNTSTVKNSEVALDSPATEATKESVMVPDSQELTPKRVEGESLFPQKSDSNEIKVSILYTGKSLGVLGKTRFQEEHERVLDYGIDKDLDFKLVSHACWKALGITIFMPSDEPEGHELELILNQRVNWKRVGSVPALITDNVLLFEDPEMKDLDMLEIILSNKLTDRQFPEIEPVTVNLYSCEIEEGKLCFIVEEENAQWPLLVDHWNTGEINRVDLGKIGRLFELPYNHGNFGSRSTIFQEIEKKGTSNTHFVKVDLGHRNGDFDLSQLERAQIDMEGLESLGYKILVPFEHELSLGLESLAGLNEKHPDLTMIATNLKTSTTKIFERSIVLTMGNLKIGFIGLIDPELQTNLSGDLLNALSFKDLTKSAQQEVDDLIDEEVDLIVALSNMSGPGNALLAENVKGIDLVLSNLTANGTPYHLSRQIEIPKGTARGVGPPHLIASNYDYGIAVGKVDLYFEWDSSHSENQLTLIEERNYAVSDKIGSDTSLIKSLTAKLDLVQRPKGDLMFPAFVDIVEQENDLKDFDKTTEHGRMSKGLWETFLANLLRKNTPSELAIIRQVPSFLPLIGKLHEREVRSWLWLEDNIVMMDLKGRDIRRLLETNQSDHLVTSGIESFDTPRGIFHMIMDRPLIDDAYYRIATTNVISQGSLEEYFSFSLRNSEQFTIQSNGELREDKNGGNVGLRDYVLSELKRIRSLGGGKEHHRRIASYLLPDAPYESLVTFNFVRPTLWTSINRSYSNEGYESVPESRIISNNSFVIGAQGGLELKLDGRSSTWDLGFNFAFAQQSASIGDGVTQKTETMDDLGAQLTYRLKGKKGRGFHPFVRFEYDSEITPTFNSATEMDNPRQSILRSVLGISKGFSPKWPRFEVGATAENDFSNRHYQYGLQAKSINRVPLDKYWRVIYTFTNNINYFFPTENDTERELSLKYNMVHELLIPLFGDLSFSVAGDMLLYRGKVDINRDPGMNLLVRVGITYDRLWKPRFQSLF